MMKPFFVCTGLCLNQGLLYAQTALVVALSNYAPLSNWPSTHAANDVPLVVNTLLKQGFKKENIRVLEDAAATKTGIENAIQSGLLDGAVSGGTVVLHFSGHGQQVQDDNSDEADGLDEALASFDSPKDYKPGQYQGENLIRDEQLNRLLAPVRQKLGPSGQLLVVIDASYIGAGSRGQWTGRGTDVIMADPAVLERLQSAGPVAAANGLDPLLSPDMAPMVVLLASTNGAGGAEPAGDDDKRVGALTYAFTKALNEAVPGSTYADLMDDIRRILSAKASLQTPGLEGDARQRVLGGNFPSLRRFAVSDFDKKKQQVRLDGGLLQGLVVGSEMAFYPAAVSDTGSVPALARGSVVAANLLQATVQLTANVSASKMRASTACFRRRSFGGLQVGVGITMPAGQLAEKIRAECRAMPFVRLDAENPDLYVLHADSARIEVRTRDSLLLYSDSDTAAVAGALAGQIRKFAQAQYFRELKLDEPALRTRLELIPVKGAIENRKFVEQTRYSIADRTDPSGNIFLIPKDNFRVKITSQGDRPVYYTVLAVSPDNEMHVLEPRSANKKTAATLVPLQPGDSLESAVFSMPPLEGIWSLKLIASETPLDLDAVLNNKGQLMRGASAREWNAVEQFFAESFKNVADLPAIPPGAASISTLVFSVGNPALRKF